MIILGQTKGGFILEASETEVANLIGFHSQYSCGSRNMPQVGATIQVNEMYTQLYRVKAIRSQVKTISDAAAALAEAIRTKMPVIEPIIAAIETAEPKTEK